MASLQLRLALLLEAAGYLLLGIWLQRSAGWHVGEIAVAVIAVFLLLRLVPVVVSLLFLARFPAAGRTGMSGPRWFALAWQELWAMLVLFLVVQPFERRWMGPDRLRPSPERPPLLLLHGYQCNRGFWIGLRPALERAGWVVATHNLEPVLAEIDRYAEGIEQRIAEVLAATGAEKVILVGHSMGGLAARAYLRRYGTGHVARLLTLGSPHHGSRIATLAWGPNGLQMRFRSVWLAALEEAALPADSVSIYSRDDNHVMPPDDCSRLAGARNVAIDGVSHLGMAFSPRLRDTLLAELAAA